MTLGLTAAGSIAYGVFAWDKDDVDPGVLGFVVVVLLGVATWLLIRSMRRQLRKIDFVEPGDDSPAGDDTDGSSPATDESPGEGQRP